MIIKWHLKWMKKTVGRYKNFGIDLMKNNNQVKDVYLPVPAVYLINTDGAVFFRFFDEDYKKRLAVSDILLALKGGK